LHNFFDERNKIFTFAVRRQKCVYEELILLTQFTQLKPIS